MASIATNTTFANTGRRAESNLSEPIQNIEQPVACTSRNSEAIEPIRPPSSASDAIDQQPLVAQLAKLGIKVRDFAYERTLPPVRTIYRHPRQVQPSVPRPFQREDTETEEDGSFSQQPQGAAGTKQLERTLTEPAIEPVSTGPAPPARMRGFLNLDDYNPEDDNLGDQQPIPYRETPVNSQMPQATFYSQESEPYVNTPLVTPQDSLQLEVNNTSNIPASQLDVESQATAPEVFSYSQLGFPQPEEFSQHAMNSQFNLPSRQSSPLSPAPSSPSRYASSPLASKNSSSIFPQTQVSTSANLRINSNTNSIMSPRVIGSRYQLRNRKISTGPQTSPAKPSKRARTSSTSGPSVLPSRPHTAVQANHLRTKSKGEASSPGARTPRQPTKGRGKRRLS